MKNHQIASFVTCFVLVLSGLNLQAQIIFTRSAEITFFSEAPLENIEAVNNTATSVIDTENNRLEFAALIRAFQFEKALMQEHFNENYMESNSFPKATFKGQFSNVDEIDWSADGSYEVTVSGDLNIHGVTHNITAPGTIQITNGLVNANSVFTVAVADYGIEIPNVVKDNIAKEVEIRVNVDYQPLEQ